MGTTGVDMAKVTETISGSSVRALIAPNMAKQVVALQLRSSEFAEEK